MRRKFSWEAFDENFLKSILYSNESDRKIKRHPVIPKEIILKEQLVPYMDSIIGHEPDVFLLREYKNEIIENFFNGSTRMIDLMKALEKKHNPHANARWDMERMTVELKKMRLTSTVCQEILSIFFREGRYFSEDEELSMFAAPKTIDLKGSRAEELPLYDYQKKAVEKLDDWFIEKDNGSGILVMPTGSGKTRVATRFLLQDMIGRGWQVVWLTHRSMLIDQAADAIYNAAPIVKFTDSSREQFRMICVSGSHSTIRAAEEKDDVIILGVQTVIRNLEYLAPCLKEKVLIVIDESHHAVAPSYLMVINEIRRLRKNVKLLGLTATPVRMQEKETDKLMKLFGSHVVYSVNMSDLIAKGFLASPEVISIDSNIDFDTTISIDEKKYISKWGELSPELEEKIAQNKERNTLIADTYMRDREKYGKTLMFAVNGTHCRTLCEELTARGVKCDYIYCSNTDNDIKIDRFRKGEIDVLVNISIMTEGTDVPDIQTVFLTRPTSSDTLLMQMIGRGMRGKDCGGTEKLYVVDFHDKWGSFARWLTPRFDMTSDPEITVEPEEKSDSANRKEKDRIDWDQIRFLMDSVKVSIAGNGTADPVIPVGWYDAIDPDGNDTKVLVYDSQVSGYLDFWKKKDRFADPDFTAERALDECFSTFGLAPSENDLALLMDTYNKAKASGSLSDFMPQHLNRIKDRDKADASRVAERFKERNIGINDVDAEIEKVYNDNKQIIDSIYGSLDIYSGRVNDYLRYPNGIKPLGTKIEECDIEILDGYDPGPKYDQAGLDALVAEVIAERFEGDYGYIPPVRWTNKRLKGYYGQYRYPQEGPAEGHDRILINSLLNSETVPKEALKFVIYHELLHKTNHSHDKAFKEQEHRYPDYVSLEKFLDNTFLKYDVRFEK